MNISLKGKRALVTGANSGIGKAVALALGASGAKVAVNYIVHPEAAQDVKQTIEKEGQEALAIQTDVSNPSQVSEMFSQIDKAWGGIDILVNNAGIDGKHMLSWEADIESWRKVININLIGAFSCASEALRRMVAQKSGVIINVTSVHEVIAWSGYSAYTAAKAGLSMLSKTLAQEAAPYGVRVLSLAPGAIKTAINQNVWSNAEALHDLLEKIPLKRMGNTDEIAKMAVVLASDLASYLTGSSVFVDGAMTDYPDFSHGG
ncbi:MAG: glucose 1-dehydrogenase [Trueperaceae bacterium]|nr:glucose 1-dehydrogenase [Trueperaceae bacterium]